MSRLPQPGGDTGSWGDILNDFLSQSHDAAGALKNGSVGSPQIQDGIIAASKLSPGVNASLSSAQTAVQTVNNKTGTTVSVGMVDLPEAASATDGQALLKNGATWSPVSVATASALAAATANKADSARQVPGTSAIVQKVEQYGHSIGYGSGATDPTTAAPAAKVAVQLGATVDNQAIPGSDLCDSNPGSGGWGRVFTHAIRSSGGTASPSFITSGLNGIGAHGPTVVTFGGAFTHSLRSVISWLLMKPGTWHDATDASITYGSGWADFAANANSGNQPLRYSDATTTRTYTINLDSSFKGGVVAIFELLQGITASNWGGVHSWTLDGNPIDSPTVVDTRGIAPEGAHPDNIPVVQRVHVPSGSHTITCTIAAGNGYHATLGWGIEQGPGIPIVVDNQYLLHSYAAWTNNPSMFAFTPTDADVTTMNTSMATVVKEFGSNVNLADIAATLSKRDDLLSSDLTHLSDDGYRVKAGIDWQVIQRNPSLVPAAIVA